MGLKWRKAHLLIFIKGEVNYNRTPVVRERGKNREKE